MGRDFDAPRKLKQMMIEAGFEDVVEKQILAPINSWPLDPRDKLIGNWICTNGLRAAESLRKVMIVGGLPEDEAPDLIARIRSDLTNANMRVYEPRKCNHNLWMIRTVYADGHCRVCGLWKKASCRDEDWNLRVACNVASVTWKFKSQLVTRTRS